MSLQAEPTRALSADLLLLHAPAFFDFRGEDQVYWPYMSSGGSEPITPLYEVMPVGFMTLQRFLRDRGHSVEITNVSTVLLRFPDCRLDKLIADCGVRVIGIDLHWMIHVQGALALAAFIKRLRPDIAILFGGISSTYFADELIRLPTIDFVMRGYDTHEPMDALLRAVATGSPLEAVPNLSWKRVDGTVVQNRLSHTPRRLSVGMDLSSLPQVRTKGFPIRDVLTVENAGCVHNCGWCGGSREAFRRINGVTHPIAQKDMAELAFEMQTVSRNPGNIPYNFYSLGTYSEPKKRLLTLLDAMAEAELGSVMYDQFFLPPDEIVERMVRTGKKITINLSPQSHDREVSRLSGRGTYDMDEMERWIDRALDLGVDKVDVYFFVGMPGQDVRSVGATVEYCRAFLAKFEGRRAHPYICPMAPILDPGSNYFVAPDDWGFRVLRRTLEEHRAGMERASLINRMNYETEWMTAGEIIDSSYRAIRDLFVAKSEIGLFPSPIVGPVVAALEDAIEFMPTVHEADSLHDPRERERALRGLASEIGRRNELLFRGDVLNQAFPIQRAVGNRWYDQVAWSDEAIRASAGSSGESARLARAATGAPVGT